MIPAILIVLSPLPRERSQYQNDCAIYKQMMDRNLEVSNTDRRQQSRNDWKVNWKISFTSTNYYKKQARHGILWRFLLAVLRGRSRTDDNLSDTIRKMQGTGNCYYNFSALASLLLSLLVNQTWKSYLWKCTNTFSLAIDIKINFLPWTMHFE